MVISKTGQTSSFTKTSSPVSGRVDVISSTDNNVASFKLRNVVKADQKPYGCLISVKVANPTLPIQNVRSRIYNLQVLGTDISYLPLIIYLKKVSNKIFIVYCIRYK